MTDRGSTAPSKATWTFLRLASAPADSRSPGNYGKSFIRFTSSERLVGSESRRTDLRMKKMRAQSSVRAKTPRIMRFMVGIEEDSTICYRCLPNLSAAAVASSSPWRRCLSV